MQLDLRQKPIKQLQPHYQQSSAHKSTVAASFPQTNIEIKDTEKLIKINKLFNSNMRDKTKDQGIIQWATSIGITPMRNRT